jgi:hypothetical protein
LDTLHEITIWVGAHAAPAFLERLFGTQRPSDGAQLLKAGSNPDVDRMHALLSSLRKQRPSYVPLRVVRQGSPAFDSRLFSRLYANAYEPFLFQLMAEQRPKL